MVENSGKVQINIQAHKSPIVILLLPIYNNVAAKKV
jgi:hypothetical protein